MSMKDLFTQSLTAIEPFEYGSLTYIYHDDLVENLMELLDNPTDRYPEILAYIQDYRSDHNLGEGTEFVPPIVPFSRHGMYYEVMHFPDQEDIDQVLAEAYEDGNIRLTKNRYAPEWYMAELDVQFEIVKRLTGKTSNEINPVLLRHIQERTPLAVKRLENGFVHNPDQRHYTQPLPIDYDEDNFAEGYLNGEREYKLPYLYEILSNDAYGNQYSLPEGDWTQAFRTYAKKVVESNGYLYDVPLGSVSPKPLDLPENIGVLGREITTNRNYIWTNRFGFDCIPIQVMKSFLLAKGIGLSPSQIESQLLGRNGQWTSALTLAGFDTEVTERNAKDFPRELPFNTDSPYFKAVGKKIGNQRSDIDRLDLSIGFPVGLQAFVIDNEIGSLVYMSIVGSLNSVHANWAALVQDKVHYFAGNSFKVGNARNHIKIETRLPSGLVQMIMLIHEASPATIQTNSKFAYLLEIPGDDDQQVPTNFIGTLNKLVEVPVLEAWSEYLWVKGITTGLITHAGEPSRQIGSTIWKIRKGAEDLESGWSAIISTSIKAGEISICT